MSFGDAVQRRADLLRQRGADMDHIFRETCKGAAMRAVAAAQDRTPPMEAGLGGVGTRSGELKQHWATDSKVDPIRYSAGDTVEYVAELANDMEYASYVDQGHRVDKHFVPGLIVNPATGRLEQVDPSLGGIMVGTKTAYVAGAFMDEAGHEAFEDTALKELNRVAREVFRP